MVTRLLSTLFALVAAVLTLSCSPTAIIVEELDSEEEVITPPVDEEGEKEQEVSGTVPIVFYLKNLPTISKDPSMDSDEAIIADLKSNGFFVIEVDCGSYPSTSPEFEEALMQFHSGAVEYVSNLLPESADPDYATILYVPEGYRVAHNVPVWNIQEHGAARSLNRILETYNNHVVKNKGQERANSVSEMVGPNGEPLDYNLHIDIIYPTGSKKVPLLLNLSSNTPRFHPFSPIGNRQNVYRTIFPLGFLSSGYAFANLDHCYNPLARREMYGHFEPHTLDHYNGVAYTTASIRYLRKMANQYNLNNRIGVMGLSKASYNAMISANVNNNRLPEWSSQDGPVNPNQPHSGYVSTVDVVYASAGDGTRRISRLIDSETVPMVTSAGKSDQYGHWNVYPDVINALSEVDNVRLDLWMEELGHTYPALGVDLATGIDRYVLVKRFFDRFLKPDEHAQPQVFYILPKPNTDNVATDGRFRVLVSDGQLPSDMKGISPFEPITVRFLSTMNIASVEQHVGVYEEGDKSKAVAGKWVPSMKNSCFKFVPTQSLKANTSYQVAVAQGVKDVHGNTSSETYERNFATR